MAYFTVQVFQRDSHGVTLVNKDGETVGATSNAAPQVAAAALIIKSNGVFDYEKTQDIFHGMDNRGVCDTEDSARLGQVLDAKVALEESQ